MKKHLILTAIALTFLATERLSAAEAETAQPKKGFWERLFSCPPPKKKAKPVAKPAETAAPAASLSHESLDDGMWNYGHYGLNVSGPDAIAIGQTYPVKIKLHARDDIASVVVSDIVPEGTTLVRTDPEATVSGRNITWKHDRVNAGETREYTVYLKPDKEGDFYSCATVHAVPIACQLTKVGSARLAITKTGPAEAVINSPVSYDVTVKNVGNMTAKNVVVTDTLPPGLKDAQGRTKLEWPVGDLAPGQSHPLTVPATAVKAGKHVNKVMAKGDNTAAVDASAPTVVLVPGLKVAKSGPKMEFLGKTASYDIKVTNSGQTPLTDVVVTDTAPAATTIVSAPGGKVVGNTVTWNIAKLAPKKSQDFKVALTSMIPGTHANNVAAKSAEGLSDKAGAATLWQGVSALLISMVDDPDPIRVDDETTFTIKVTNQGTLEDSDIKLTATFEDELAPVSASNGGKVAGNTVTFPAWPKLEPKQSFTYTIKAKGLKAGDHRLKVSRTSRDIPAATTVEESTRVY